MPSNNTVVTNDPVLNRVVHGYMPKDMDFIGAEILPRLTVTSDKGDIPEAGTEFLRIHNTITVGKGATPEIDISFSKASGWATEEHRLKIAVTKKDGLQWNRTNWKAGQVKAKGIYGKMLKKTMIIGKEKGIADALTNASVITNNVTLSGSDQLNDYVNSDPLGVIKTAKDSVYDSTGFEANVIGMNRATFEVLRIHPKLKAQIAVAQGATTVPIVELSKEQLAFAFGVEKILVAKAMYETAIKGQTSSKASIWGKDIVVAYINPNPTPEVFEDSLGYSFELTPLIADSYVPLDPPNTVYVREQWEYDDVILKAAAAYLVVDAIA